MADLQEIVDDLEAEIRRPISVEDRRWRLLAHSAQPDEADAVRRSSILTRETSPPVAAWLDGLGLQRARDLVDVPRNDELGMTRRGCLPIRHGDVLLGFLWVIVGDRPLTDAERAGLQRGGEEVAANLWARHRAADERHRKTLELLERLFAKDPRAPQELAATLRWPERGAYVVAVCEGDGAIADKLRRSRAAFDVATLEAGGRLTILIRDPAAVQRALNVRNGGLSGTFTDLADAAAARDQAEIAALCARAQPALGPVAAYDQLGSWAMIAELWTAAEHPQPPPAILALVQHRRGDELLEALEGLLEHGGDVADAAKHLSMHRATLYRRLERVEEITGLDLRKGDDRLLAHLGLRLYRLNATTVAPGRE
ncbi:MAG TPA: helix-turn-helix domain-containing protein [Solirubrobacter sp.]